MLQCVSVVIVLSNILFSLEVSNVIDERNANVRSVAFNATLIELFYDKLHKAGISANNSI